MSENDQAMQSHAFIRIGATAAFVLTAALPALAQDSAIAGARVSLIEEPAGALTRRRWRRTHPTGARAPRTVLENSESAAGVILSRQLKPDME